MNDKIKNLLSNPQKLLELAEKVRGTKNDATVTEFNTVLATELDNWLKESAVSADMHEKLLAATIDSTIEGADKLPEVTDLATQIVGDWNAESAKLAQHMYEEKLGLKRKEMVGYDVLFGNKQLEGLMAYDRETLEAIPDTAFAVVKENVRMFPIQSATEAFLAIKSMSLDSLTDDEKKAVENKAAEFGVGPNWVTVIAWEGVPIATLSNINDLGDYPEDVLAEAMGEAYGLCEDEISDLATNIERLRDLYTEEFTLERAKTQLPDPIQLNAASIVSKFVQLEKQVNHLAPLVGLVRTLGVSKENFEEAAKTYNCFGVTVLEKLLERAFANSSSKEETPGTSARSESPVPTLSNPVAQAAVEADGKPSPTKSSIQLAYKPTTRRSQKKETK